MNKRAAFIGNTIAFTLILTPVISTTSVNTVYATNSNIYEVTASSLNVRSGPSTSYAIVGKLSSGSRIEVYEINKGWAKIKNNNGYGYCSEQYLKKVSNSNTNLKVLNMSVYLRKENNWSAEKIALIPKGEKISVISSSNDWVKVSYNGKEGYITSQYLENYTPDSSVPDTNLPSNDQTTSKITKTTTTDLNMRTGAGTNYNIIITIPKDKTVSVISSNNGWDYVEYNGKKGYVSNKYLKVKEIALPPTTQEPEITNTNKIEFKINSTSDTQQIEIISDNEVEYSSFYMDSPKRLVIDLKESKLKNTDNISDTAINGSAIKLYRASYKKEDNSTRLTIELNNDYDTKNTVISKNGSKISINFKVENNESTTPSEPTEENIYYTTASSLNIRSGAGTSYSIIGKLTSGSAVNVISISNGWAKIKYNNGYGYCSESYLIKASSNETNDERINAVINLAKQQLGKAYKYGAEGPNSFDCSGLVFYVYKNSLGVSLPRTSKDQSKYGTYVSKGNLKPGDLVFFDNSYGTNVNHVGIYIGDNQMIHSPRSGDVVKIQKIDTTYYTKAYVTARRIIN